MSYRYSSKLRPLGCWLNLDQTVTIEDPTPADVDPFDPEWKIHNVLVTETPLQAEKIKSLQLLDVQQAQAQKKLYDLLMSMKLDCNAKVEICIKFELGDKIKAGKIKDEATLNKLVKKNVDYTKRCMA